MNKKESLEFLIKQLPIKIEVNKINYDLIIFLYKNQIQYSEIGITYDYLKIKKTLINFYGENLIENVQDMINYLKNIDYTILK